MDSRWRVLQRATRVRSILPMKKTAWSRNGSEGIPSMKGRWVVDGARLFSAVLSDKTRTMGPHRSTGGSL